MPITNLAKGLRAKVATTVGSPFRVHAETHRAIGLLSFRELNRGNTFGDLPRVDTVATHYLTEAKV